MQILNFIGRNEDFKGSLAWFNGIEKRKNISSTGNSSTLVHPNLTFTYGIIDEDSVP